MARARATVMPRAARRYDIHVPLAFNDGRPISRRQIKSVENRLLEHFGGVTGVKPDQALRGLWRSEIRIFIDQVIVLTVVDFCPRGIARFIAELKRDLLRDFEQLEILITETALRVH